MIRSVLPLFAFGLAASMLHAAISVASFPFTYSQDFDSLTQITTNQTWTNDSTLPGWYLFRRTSASDVTPVAITQYVGGTGSSSTGSFYSFGVDGTNTIDDRALGGVGSGSTYFGSPSAGAIAGWIAVGFVNNANLAATGFTVSFTGEQWRNGGNTSAQTMVLEYGIGNTFDAVATWTAPGGAFDFTSLVNTSTAAALDGNDQANRTTGLGGTVNVGLATGQTIWLRWLEVNDTGSDHGLAIDDLSFQLIPVPEPASIALLGLVGLALIRRRRAANR